jgi:hypothetical protein
MIAKLNLIKEKIKREKAEKNFSAWYIKRLSLSEKR